METQFTPKEGSTPSNGHGQADKKHGERRPWLQDDPGNMTQQGMGQHQVDLMVEGAANTVREKVERLREKNIQPPFRLVFALEVLEDEDL